MVFAFVAALGGATITTVALAPFVLAHVLVSIPTLVWYDVCVAFGVFLLALGFSAPATVKDKIVVACLVVATLLFSVAVIKASSNPFIFLPPSLNFF